MKQENMNTDKKPTLKGRFYEGAHEHQVYEIHAAVPDILDEIGKLLVTKFGCTQPDSPNFGWNNSINTHCRKNQIVLDLSWHPLFGFCITTNLDEGDDLVRRIGNHLNTIIGGEEFEQYLRHD